MICGFKVRWYVGGMIDNHYVESGYVAGTDYDNCFSKVRDWYFADEPQEMQSIEISMVPCVDREHDIVAIERIAPEDITVEYDPDNCVDGPDFDCDED